MKETLESVAYCKAHNIVKSWSDDNLLSVWEAATSRYASPEDGWGTNIDGSWVVLTWDEWTDILYSEITLRGLSNH
jgi:hypothetical protein